MKGSKERYEKQSTSSSSSSSSYSFPSFELLEATFPTVFQTKITLEDDDDDTSLVDNDLATHHKKQKKNQQQQQQMGSNIYTIVNEEEGVDISTTTTTAITRGIVDVTEDLFQIEVKSQSSELRYNPYIDSDVLFPSITTSSASTSAIDPLKEEQLVLIDDFAEGIFLSVSFILSSFI